MIELRNYQSAAVESLFNYWETNTGNPLISAPMGSGKSIIIAAFIREALRLYPETRIIVLSHVAKILTQDFTALHKLWSEAPVGIYSAGLKKRQMQSQILFAGIQSIFKKGYENRHTDLVIIDEAHLLSPNDETRYRTFLKALKDNNPYLKCAGFSGTPYRIDSGWLHKGENALFTDICYDINILDLIKQGYLVEPISKASEIKIDLSKIHTRGGEFISSELQAAMDKESITKAAVREIIEFGKDRKLWVIFSSGLSHSKHICEELRSNGITCESIDGNTPEHERTLLFQKAQTENIKCLVNYGTMTTGVDIPEIDMIALLRKTKSTSLYLQMVGRGLRLSDGKKDCAILDFCGNCEYHGVIDNVIIRDKNSEEGEAPAKECPQCHSIIAAGYRICPDCGFLFPPPKIKVEAKAKKAPLLTTQVEKYDEWTAVQNVAYSIHKKFGSPDSLKVTYNCDRHFINEWVGFEHPHDFVRKKASSWWLSRHGKHPIPGTAQEALDRIDEIGNVMCWRIKIIREGKYPEIKSHDLIRAQAPITKSTGNLGTTYIQQDAPNEQTKSA